MKGRSPAAFAADGGMWLVTAALLGVAPAACGTASADQAPPRKPTEGRTASRPAFACLGADSIGGGRDTLVFSNVELADETFDATGTEISLWSEDGRLRGSVRQAEGELGAPGPLRSLRVDPHSGKMLLAYASDETNGVRFEGAFSCQRLVGTWELYPGVREENSVLPRVPHSGYTPPAPR